MKKLKLLPSTRREKIAYIIFAGVLLLALVFTPVFMYVYYLDTRPYMDTVEYVRAYTPSAEIESGLSGEKLQQAIDKAASELSVVAVYESGRELEVDASSYEVSCNIDEDDVSRVGEYFSLNVKLKMDNPVSCSIPIYATLAQAESGTVVGGTVSEENGVTRAGNFTYLTSNPEDHYVEVNVNSAAAGAARVMVRVSNGNIHGDAMIWAPPLPLEKVSRLYVNGAEKDIAPTAIVPAGDLLGSDMYGTFFNTYYTIDLGEVQLKQGANTIRFCLVDSGDSAYVNIWNEPVTVNVDYIRVLPVQGEGADSLFVSGAGDSVSVSAGEEFKTALTDALGEYCVAVVKGGNIRFIDINDSAVSVTARNAEEQTEEEQTEEQEVVPLELTQAGGKYIVTVAYGGKSTEISVEA